MNAPTETELECVASWLAAEIAYAITIFISDRRLMATNAQIAPANLDFEHRSWPYCNVCNKPVADIEYENVIETIWGMWGPNGPGDNSGPTPFAHHTGEIIVTIRCHGEVYRVSNFRGRLR